MRTTHSPPQLMQLGQAELVGIFHYQSINAGDVYARLYDRGADKHIVAARHEVGRHFFQSRAVHLAVRHNEAGFGQHRSQLFGFFLNGAHTIMDIKRLALP